jgi:predicted N-acetyltransferase YhbS
MNHQTTQATTFDIKPESAALTAAVEQMLDLVFGPARFDKASYLFREGVDPVPELSYVATVGDDVVGTIRYWPIHVGAGNHKALLLGPLGITPRLAGKGIGRTLTFRTLEVAAEMGHDLVLLVGDVDYYKRFGFVPATPHGFVMPGEKRPERLQVAPLKRGILGSVSGDIRHIHGRAIVPAFTPTLTPAASPLQADAR